MHLPSSGKVPNDTARTRCCAGNTAIDRTMNCA